MGPPARSGAGLATMLRSANDDLSRWLRFTPFGWSRIHNERWRGCCAASTQAHCQRTNQTGKTAIRLHGRGGN
eukprot:1018567-Lingulodinium_polyedra.AAC.1